MALGNLLTPEDEDRFLCFGEIAEMQAGARSGIYNDGIMHLLVSGLFRGDFDPPSTGRAPYRAQFANLELQRTIAFPFITPPFFDAKGTLIAPPEFLGWHYGSRESVLWLLADRRALPFELQTPCSEDEIARGLEILVEYNFDRYPEYAKAILDNVRIAKPKLRLWFEMRGLDAPWMIAAPSEPPPTSDASPEDDTSLTRGRPRKRAWERIEKLVKHLHKAQPELSLKCLAREVLEMVGAEFPDDEIPSFSTLQKSIGNILSK